MQIARKVVLVPFGEKVPLPQILTDFINKLFFKHDRTVISTYANSPNDLKEALLLISKKKAATLRPFLNSLI